ncbi:GTP-binding protein [Roseomonas sp. GC11]|uniref:flagellar biosynthesis protein FlhF n=1 Tax=Roseomonas sp. GC11 TaxID=2950546 RepID=UPI00210BFB83|nr:GTP-binding protein [Roseomonas sp. GC11]MCQ4159373.1 GTP-binding protein [Roseomonas sp. GC11]
MRIRVIRAPSMAEAMRRLVAELGPDAVLLSSRHVDDGVEATAALETDPHDEPLPEVEPAPAPEPRAEAAALAFHNLPPALRERLLAGPLEAMLAASFRFGGLPPLGQRPLLLAGPPGAGKTLTVVKLAARRVLEGEPPPLLVNADQQRPGAAEQLLGVAEVLGAPLAQAPSPAAALQAIALRPAGGAVLIDTPGVDPFEPEQARALAGLIAATRPAVVLVLPAGLDCAEATELARAFRALGATHLLPTRLDAARRLGGVLAAASAGGLVLSLGGTGPEAAGALLPLNAAWLAARLRRRSHHPDPAPPALIAAGVSP